jgi:hypothetical protein
MLLIKLNQFHLRIRPLSSLCDLYHGALRLQI